MPLASTSGMRGNGVAKESACLTSAEIAVHVEVYDYTGSDLLGRMEYLTDGTGSRDIESPDVW
jgi:hypothetical protein